MRRKLEDSDEWDEGFNCGGCGCHGCGGGGHDESDEWYDESGDEEATVPCPYCGEEVYEDTPRCPHCGQYISAEDAPPRRLPWWIILGVVFCLCAIVVWIVLF